MIRVIAGRWRGKKLDVPAGDISRPTTDRMRERIFSMLQHPRYPSLTGARVADLFAGSGALGIEALSRGAAHVTAVERSPEAAAVIARNVAGLAEPVDHHLVRGDAASFAARTPFDIIFMDPPYGEGLIDAALAQINDTALLADGGVIVAEWHKDDRPQVPARMTIVDTRRQGIQQIQFITA